MPLLSRKELLEAAKDKSSKDEKSSPKPETRPEPEEQEDEVVEEIMEEEPDLTEEESEEDDLLDDSEPETLEEPMMDFDLSDHLERILSLLGLTKIDGEKSGLPSMLQRMLDPDLIKSMPFADLTMDDDIAGKLNNLKGKVVALHGQKVGDEPMQIKKKVIDIGDDDERDLEDGIDNVRERIDDIGCPAEKEAFSSSNENGKRYLGSLRVAHDFARQCANKAPEINSKEVAEIIRRIDAVAQRIYLEPQMRVVVSDIVSDLSAYTLAPEFFTSVADRIKAVYHAMREDQNMVKQAYYIIRERPVDVVEGRYNICPRVKTQLKSEIEMPVEWTYCLTQCVEGRQEDDGSVSCKYARWLEDVLQTHEEVFDKLDVHVNPANKDMNLRLPDGERSHPEKPGMKFLEARLEEANVRGREWDELKKAKKIPSKAAGKMLNIENLIEEMLGAKDIHRDDKGNEVPIEKKLRSVTADGDPPETNVEPRLDSRRDDKFHAEAGTEETRNEPIHDEYSVRMMGLIDELLEHHDPREDWKRPSK